MFEQLTFSKEDPILGINEDFKQDPRTNKINLSIGVYKNEKGEIPILETVKKTEQLIAMEEKTKVYTPIEGTKIFAQETQHLLFDKNNPAVKNGNIMTAQSLGGTGALYIASKLLSEKLGSKRIWLSNPSWPNHEAIFNAAGFEICYYRYYNEMLHSFDFDGMFNDLKQAKQNDVVLFHGCCHNPTGFDPNFEQWKLLCELARNQNFLPLFDFAYQGFSVGLNEDVEHLRYFSQQVPELIVCNSYSKNFGIYNERVGGISVLCKTPENALTTLSQIKSIIRTTYSNPAAHGANIVERILSNPNLKQEWENEVAFMRERILRMRNLFVKTLIEHDAKRDFDFVLKQNGMFSYSGLTKEQIDRLRNDFGIYAIDSGRINIAGITIENMSSLCDAIISVL